MLLLISYRSSGEKVIKYLDNSSCVIMSVILMTTLFYKALILQRESWCWSPLGLIGVNNDNSKDSPVKVLELLLLLLLRWLHVLHLYVALFLQSIKVYPIALGVYSPSWDLSCPQQTSFLKPVCCCCCYYYYYYYYYYSFWNKNPSPRWDWNPRCISDMP